MKARCLSLVAIIAWFFFPLVAEANIAGNLSFNSEDFNPSQLVEKDGNTYTIINVVGHGAHAFPGSPGDPELPAVNFLYSLPPGMEIDKIVITSFNEVLLSRLSHPVHPIQNPIPDSGQSEFVGPGPIYVKPGIYPPQDRIGSALNPVACIRGSGVGTIQIRPIRYDILHNRLLIITQINFEIVLRPAHLKAVAPERESWLTHDETVSFLKSLVQNSPDVEPNMPPVEIITDFNPQWNTPKHCLIITNQDLSLSWVPYRDWLTAQGRPAEIVTVNNIYYHYAGRDNPEKIRNYLIDRYRNDGIGSVLLGGNVGIVPARLTNAGGYQLVLCDLYYADLSGDWDTDGDGVWGEYPDDNYDIGADVMVARVPAETPADVSNWWTKRLRYEINPGNGDRTYLSQTMISSTDQMRDYEWYQDVNMCLSEIYDVDFTTLREMPSGSDPEPSSPSGIDAVNALNQGVHILELVNHGHTDFCIMRSRGSGGDYDLDWLYDTGSIQQIIPGKDHITFAISCLLGNIDFGDPNHPADDCFAQVDLTSPGGSVAARYNSRPVWYWREATQLEAVTLMLIIEYRFPLSAAHYYAKLFYPFDDPFQMTRDRICSNNLFGCPIMRVWRPSVNNFAAGYPAHVTISRRDSTGAPIPTEITVAVTDEDLQVPVSEALVTLWKDGEVYSLQNSDSNGVASFEVIIDTEGSISLRITKDNYITYQNFISVDSLSNLGRIRPKPETVLPALIWNPHYLSSGDSLNSSLQTAGYESHLTSDLAPYLDSLNNFHLFVIGGVTEEVVDSFIMPLEYEPFRAAIDTFLEHGGSLFWEGVWSLDCAINPENCNVPIMEDELLRDYMQAFVWMPIDTFSFSYIQGVAGSYFVDITNLGYRGTAITYPVLATWEGGVNTPLIAPEAGSLPGKAAVCAYRNSHTMATNFSWSRLHDNYTSIRAQLITDIMDWLSSTTQINDNKPGIPNEYSLSQNYPNPFNARTNIKYALPRPSDVSIDIFDISGRKIESLEGGYKEAGVHSIVWNPGDRASGIYFYRIKAGEFSRTRKCILIK